MSFNAASRKVLANVWIDDAYYPVKVRNVEYRTEVNSNGDHLLPGGTACASVDIKVHGEIFEDLTGQKVDIRFNAFDNNIGGNAEMFALGEFTVTGQEYVAGSGATIIHATDVMAKLDKTDYVSSLFYPATTWDILNEIMELAGVTIFWDEPGGTSTPGSMMIKEKPVGYTCREMLGHIAGMFGRYAIDCTQVSTSNVSYRNAVVLRYYTDDDMMILPNQIHMGGLKLKTTQAQSGTPVAYVEFDMEVTEGGPSTAPDDADPTDIRYMQNPNELRGKENFLPYWVIACPIETPEGKAPEYTVFFTDAPTTFYWNVTGPTFLGVYTYELRSLDTFATYTTNHAMNTSNTYLEWLEKMSGLIFEYYHDYILIESYKDGGAYIGEQTMKIVAANYDVYMTDGTLLLARNDSIVGSLRNEATEGGAVLTFGEGDYTNPFIDKDNINAVQLMQMNYYHWPGSVKWRGHPKVRPGTIVYVVDRSDKLIPFLICSLSLHYDGGLYMVAECHGSAETFDKKPGIQRELKKIRGMKAVWEATNQEGTT